MQQTLSKDAVKLLQWFDTHTEQGYYEKELREECPCFDIELLNVLADEQLISTWKNEYDVECLPDDTVQYPIVYSYSPRGRGYLERLEKESSEKRKDDVRYWITTGIAVLALIFSVFPEFRDVCVEFLKGLFGH